MKILISLLIGFLMSGCLVHFAEKVTLYEDSEIKAIRMQFASGGDKVASDPAYDPALLKVVPNGETKKLKRIFKELGMDSKRLGEPRIGAVNMVKFYVWRVSPRFELSIMVATNDRENDFSRTGNLNGYGVRISERKEDR
jgi:hypothetical protein